MALKPSDWSAVVIGRWNRAILTPRGIAQRVFRLPEGTPIQVLVPIDAVGMNSVIVKHGEFQATVDDSRLQIHLEHGNFDALERAMVLADAAIDSLPVTPFSAVGFNIRYIESEAQESLQKILTYEAFDERLAERFTITARSYQRSVDFQNGKINISISRDSDGDYVVQLNFDRTSTDVPELRQWLQMQIEDVREEATWLIGEFMGLEIEEDANAEVE